MVKRKYYDWDKTMSYQTGTDGEFCIVVGAKNIGKTFGLRKKLVERFLKNGTRFCEICRTKEEMKGVRQGYFDKLQGQGFFTGYVFDVEGQNGRIAKIIERDADTGEVKHAPWQVICYFVALTAFQQEKKRTYEHVGAFIFDEGIIDVKDRYHRYLPNEYLILANLLDSISRQQPDGDAYRVYILGNACDLTAPYLRYAGVDRIPDYGYSYYNHRHTLLHYVEPWDSEVMKRQTLVGRMLEGFADESAMVFDNKFIADDSGEVAPKPKTARYAFALRYGPHTFAAWVDYKAAMLYVTRKPPKNAKNVLALTKADSSINYTNVDKAHPYLKMLSESYYLGNLRYDTQVTRELFFSVLDFLGIK